MSRSRSHAICILCAAALLRLCASKGCFIKSSYVLMADGSAKQLQHVQLGDEVISWDDSSQKPATSRVQAFQVVERRASDMIEINLGSNSSAIHATADHPFWSRSKQAVVSMHPNMTKAEYGLQTSLLDIQDKFEDKWQQPVQISSIRRSGSTFLSGEKLEVMTLCLWPHHWFYVGGVRVHNKGCFVPSTSVLMNNGMQKPIGQIRKNDIVLSWDDDTQKLVSSTVQAVQVVERSASDMIEIGLASATRTSSPIYATADHPFWSRSRQALVSMHPNMTRAEYGLEASLIDTQDRLEDKLQQPVQISSIRRTGPTFFSHRSLEVMTLCLWPHHWFYVEGVRVHNKGGCFVPWTPVLMNNGMFKPIGDVVINDRVLSWDMATEQGVEATVIGIDMFEARDLMEITYNDTFGENLQVKSQSVLLTRDHPIWSAGQRQLVSNTPMVTKRLYGLNVSQLSPMEKLRHHSGHDVLGEVRPWQGNASHVMTLRLDTHHWFYAGGILVHNKGGGGGGSGAGGGGGFSSVRTVSHTRSSMGTRAYVGFIFLHGGSRRRHDNLAQKDDNSKCEVATKAEINSRCKASVYGPLDSSCQKAEGASSTCTDIHQDGDCSCCHKCIQCTEATCTDSINGCAEFLGNIFTKCEEDVEESDYTILIVIAVLVVVGLLGCVGYKYFKSKGGGSPDMARRQHERESLMPVNCKGQLVLKLNGTYSENDETKPCSYSLTINAEGNVIGEARDDDGTAKVIGKVAWSDAEQFGKIMWREAGAQTMEVEGRLSFDGSAYGIQADYLSNYRNTSGNLNVKSAPTAVANAPVVAGTVVGTVVGNSNNMGKTV